MKQALIIGGGTAGLQCALELAADGIESVIVESNSLPGGRAADFSCKATDKCKNCGACIVTELAARAVASPLIRFELSAEVETAQPTPEGFVVRVKTPGTEPMDLKAEALVAAIGYRPYDPAGKPRFGYGRVPGVMTALELDAAICRDEFDFSNPEKVAFIQCVGSRDAKAGRNYCSHVCCANALRLADLLRAEAGSEISVFYMDIQTFDRNPGRYFAHAKDRVRLIRSIPAEVRRGADGRPQVVYQGPEEKREIESFDRVVLSVGISPPDVRILRESLPLALDPHGFLQVSESDVPGAPGFFVTGAAKGPRSIAETMSDALLTARSVKRFLDS